MKPGDVLSYRVTEEEIERLEALRLPGEKSLAATVRRIVREAIGLSTAASTNPFTIKSTVVDNKEELSIIVDKIVNKIVDSDVFREQLGVIVGGITNTANEKFTALEARLDQLQAELIQQPLNRDAELTQDKESLLRRLESLEKQLA